MKFNVDQKLLDTGLEFPTAQEAQSSPLAAKLFGFPWTSSVFIGTNFVTVTKQDWVDWDVLAEPLAGLIKEHLDQGMAVYVEPVAFETSDDDNQALSTDSDEIKQIKQILNSEIRPIVAMDGGDVAFAKFEANILYLQMKGACNGCPSSSATLKEGIEVRFKELMPHIKEVVAI
jgi:NFU1 iron-sulfur cluster scaffold homolog, mitochondrial